MINSIGPNYITRVNSVQKNKSRNLVSSQSTQGMTSQPAQVNFTGLFDSGKLKTKIAELTVEQEKNLEIISGLNDKVEKLTGENSVLKDFVSKVKKFCQTKKTNPEEILEDLKTYFVGLNNKNSVLEKNNQDLTSQVTELKTANVLEVEKLKTANAKELEPFKSLRISPAITDEIIFPEKFVETAVKMKKELPATKEAILKYLESGELSHLEKIKEHMGLFNTLEKGINQNNYGMPKTEQLFKETNFSDDDLWKIRPYTRNMTLCMLNLIAETLIATPKFANSLYREKTIENAFPLLKYINANDEKAGCWLNHKSLKEEIARLEGKC